MSRCASCPGRSSCREAGQEGRGQGGFGLVAAMPAAPATAMHGSGHPPAHSSTCLSRVQPSGRFSRMSSVLEPPAGMAVQIDSLRRDQSPCWACDCAQFCLKLAELPCHPNPARPPTRVCVCVQLELAVELLVLGNHVQGEGAGRCRGALPQLLRLGRRHIHLQAGQGEKAGSWQKREVG